MTACRLHGSEVALGPGSHPAASAFDRCVGDALGVTAFGLYQVDPPPGSETVPHDHRDDQAQDACVVLRGSGHVVVDGEAVDVGPGDFVAVSEESTRYVRASDEGLVFIAVCAPIAA